MAKILYLIFAAILGLIAIKINSIIQLSEPPVLDEPWWGPGVASKDNPAIIPFKINISDEVLIDLKTRLNNARKFREPLEKVNQDYGMNTKLLEEIVTFWKTKYDWKQREKLLNKYPQFKTQIQGLDIHFLHVKPENIKGLKVLPLLILHGWPGSIKEFYEIIPMLTTPQKGKDFVFEIIAPSLPGYGFSQGASKQGLGTAQMAVIFKNLMQRLGFKKYYVQGGDWGAAIVHAMSVMFEDKILGLHSNFCFSWTFKTSLKQLIGSFYPPAIIDQKYENRLYPLSDFFSNILLEFGYMHLQSTKPDTLGVGLNDSPVGLAAYIIEKFTTWTNPEWKNKPDGGLKIKYKYEDLLDNVMIYWVTNSITTSVRLYSEHFRKSHIVLNMENTAVNVPAACARFANELMYYPDNLLKDRYMNLVHTKDYDDGGHFAAMEVPKLLSSDIWESIEKIEKVNKK